jgi:trimethylamine:corrinoid methyltransferase-like protein
VRGIETRGETLATAMFAQTGHSGEFLKLKETRALFRQEQYLPSAVIDRSARGSEAPSDAFSRARLRVEELASTYRKPALGKDVLLAFQSIVEREAERAGVGVALPGN